MPLLFACNRVRFSCNKIQPRMDSTVATVLDASISNTVLTINICRDVSPRLTSCVKCSVGMANSLYPDQLAPGNGKQC